MSVVSGHGCGHVSANSELLLGREDSCERSLDSVTSALYGQLLGSFSGASVFKGCTKEQLHSLGSSLVPCMDVVNAAVADIVDFRNQAESDRDDLREIAVLSACLPRNVKP